MERVLGIIRKDVAEDKVRIDTPTQNLENYFLQVVQNARRAAAETSGAISGARVAAYLRGDAEGKPATEKILERLTAPQPASPQAPVAAPEETVDQKKWAALAKPTEPTPSAPAPTPDHGKAPELEKANEKLSGLLGKKDE
jgi:hypothetical protein